MLIYIYKMFGGKTRRFRKGTLSRRTGRRDFRSHKGDKFYNRKGKRQSTNRAGVKGHPYSRRVKKRQTKGTPMKTKPGRKRYMTKKGMIRDVNHHRMMGPLAFRGGRGYAGHGHHLGGGRREEWN